MDTEGVAGEVIFPNTVPPFFRTSVLICGNPSREDYALRLEGIRAHNRWLVDFCAEHPERRAGIGLVYLNDIDDAIEDVRWIAEHGLRGGILLPHVPDDCTHILPLYAREYDRLLGRLPGHGRRRQPARRHGLARLRPPSRVAADPAARDALVLDAQLRAPAARGRLRALPEAPLHPHRGGLRLGARDAGPARRDLERRAQRRRRRVPVRQGLDAAGAAELLRASATAGTAPARPRRARSRTARRSASSASAGARTTPTTRAPIPTPARSLRHTFHDVDPAEVRRDAGRRTRPKLYGFDLGGPRAPGSQDRADAGRRGAAASAGGDPRRRPLRWRSATDGRRRRSACGPITSEKYAVSPVRDALGKSRAWRGVSAA